MLTAWIVGGGLLLALEVVVPGMVLGFLGASALFIALFIWLGWIDSWISALTSFFILSLVMLVGLRGLFQRFIGGDVERQSTDEDLEAFGAIVEVVETIAPQQPGRVRYRDATW
ncbi:MAG: NfeD family protein, partial [Candidatus Latescibacteria bacterium]|nr:NfeD family protein [Candidatus Latescibacterota bacterium]